MKARKKDSNMQFECHDHCTGHGNFKTVLNQCLACSQYTTRCERLNPTESNWPVGLSWVELSLVVWCEQALTIFNNPRPQLNHTSDVVFEKSYLLQIHRFVLRANGNSKPEWPRKSAITKVNCVFSNVGLCAMLCTIFVTPSLWCDYSAVVIAE